MVFFLQFILLNLQFEVFSSLLTVRLACYNHPYAVLEALSRKLLTLRNLASVSVVAWGLPDLFMPKFSPSFLMVKQTLLIDTLTFFAISFMMVCSSPIVDHLFSPFL